MQKIQQAVKGKVLNISKFGTPHYTPVFDSVKRISRESTKRKYRESIELHFSRKYRHS